MTTLAVALRFARRELRGGLAGFRVFLACLALGVAAIAGVNSLSAAIQDSLRSDARRLAGGDVTVRTTYNPATTDQLAFFQESGRLSHAVEMRAMAGTETKRALVELKTADTAYPLYGEVELEPALPLRDALARSGELWGAVVEASLLDQLGVRVGDTVSLGDARFAIRGTIKREPDRGIDFFSFGPRFMIGEAALAATGLLQPGSLVRHEYHVGLPAGADVPAWADALRARFPDAGWRVTRFDEAAPALRNTIERLTLFLTLVGLTALLIGGVGVVNAVRSYLATKTATIATLKCLGAPGGVVFLTYFSQILALSTVGIAIGLAIGAVTPIALGGLLRGMLPVTLAPGLHPQALLLAAAFGYLTTLVFSLWPLARAQSVPAASLFRDLVAPARGRPGTAALAAIGAAALLLAGLIVATAPERRFAAWFVVGAAGTLAVFLGAAWAVTRGAAAAGRPRQPSLRLALANLCRPGAPTASVVLSLGFAVTVLTAVALIEGNLNRQIAEQVPERAPTFFFIDIQRSQAEAFDRLAASIPGVGVAQRMPHLRARITRINGVPVAEAVVKPESQWAVRNERGLTYAATPPNGTRIVAGEWWPADYSGPPAISLDAGLARGFGVGIGDSVTFNVLGREIEARIASLREINWGELQMQFAVIFAPGALDRAPQTFIATAFAPPEAESALVKAVTDAFPNVSAIRVKDALARVTEILGQIGAAVRATASISLIAGALVLAGAIAAGQRQRIYDAVVLKVLGATRADVLRAYLLEFLLLGVVTALVGTAIGSLVAYVVLTQVMNLPWAFLPRALMGAASVCIAVTLLFGFAFVWRALGRKAAPLLRHA